LDIGTLEVLVKVAGWHYVPAAVAAFFAGGILAYHLSVRYVFTGRQLVNRSLELGSFIALGVVGVVVNVAILSLTIGQLGLDLLPAKLLTAAYELLRRTDVRPVVLESDTQVGGISKTINYRGNRMDLGGHRFFSKSDWVMSWWQALLPTAGDGQGLKLTYQGQSRELEVPPTAAHGDNVMLVRSRLSRIF